MTNPIAQPVAPDPQRYLVRARALLHAHPITMVGVNDYLIYPIGSSPATVALQQQDLMPVRAKEYDGGAYIAWRTEEERSNGEIRLNLLYPGLASIAAASVMLPFTEDSGVSDYDTPFCDLLKSENRFISVSCGSVLTLAVFYSTVLCIDRDYVRDNLSDYFEVLFDEHPGSESIFFQQIGTDKVINSPNFKALCALIDERDLFSRYFDQSLDLDEFCQNLPVFNKAKESFLSLSAEEVRWISTAVEATARKQIMVNPQYSPLNSELGYFTDTEVNLTMDMASCLALLTGEAQIEAADILLKNDRLFGLTAFSLLTSPWYEDEVRAAALQRMVREEPIIGREMAKIALVRDDRPTVTQAARELLA